MKIACPHCDTVLEPDDVSADADSIAECPECQKRFRMPDPSAVSKRKKVKRRIVPAVNSSEGSAPQTAAKRTMVVTGSGGKRASGTGIGAIKSTRPAAGVNHTATVAGEPKKPWTIFRILRVATSCIFITLGLLAFVFKPAAQGDLDYAREQIEAMELDADMQVAYLAVAKHYHEVALIRALPQQHRGLRGRRATNRTVYFRELMGLVEQRFVYMQKGPAEIMDLQGKYWLWKASDEQVVLFRMVGTYSQIVTNGDITESVGTGRWDIRNGAMHWTYPDGKTEANRFLFAGKRGFVLLEADGRGSYWEDVSHLPDYTKHFKP